MRYNMWWQQKIPKGKGCRQVVLQRDACEAPAKESLSYVGTSRKTDQAKWDEGEFLPPPRTSLSLITLFSHMVLKHEAALPFSPNGIGHRPRARASQRG